MNVYDTLVSHLQNDICPAYTAADAEEDSVALAAAMGLPAPAPDRNRQKASSEGYSYRQAKRWLGVKSDVWSILCKELPRVVDRKSIAQPPVLKAACVRRKVLRRHDNDASMWLCSTIGHGCRPWFARSMLPLHQTHELRLGYLVHAWRTVADFPDSPEIRAVVSSLKDKIVWGTNGVFFELSSWCVDACGSWRVARKHIVSRMFPQPDNPVAQAMMSTEFQDDTTRKGCMSRAEQIYTMSAYVDGHTAQRCADYIACGDQESDVAEQLLHTLQTSRREQAFARAMELDLDPDQNDATSELEEMIDEAMAKNQIDSAYEAHGLNIDELDLDDMIPLTVRHVDSNLTTDDLRPLSAVYHCTGLLRQCWWNNPRHLREMFERFVLLKISLKIKGLDLELANDSWLCAEYVFAGTYSGPVTDGMHGKDALGRVVVMMVEKHFLHRETCYEQLMCALGHSVRAKILAVRQFLNDPATDKAALPVSLCGLARRHGSHPLAVGELDLLVSQSKQGLRRLDSDL